MLTIGSIVDAMGLLIVMKKYFYARITNAWNSLLSSVISASTTDFFVTSSTSPSWTNSGLYSGAIRILPVFMITNYKAS